MKKEEFKTLWQRMTEHPIIYPRNYPFSRGFTPCPFVRF